jgi:hypothetical protein
MALLLPNGNSVKDVPCKSKLFRTKYRFDSNEGETFKDQAKIPFVPPFYSRRYREMLIFLVNLAHRKSGGDNDIRVLPLNVLCSKFLKD